MNIPFVYVLPVSCLFVIIMLFLVFFHLQMNNQQCKQGLLILLLKKYIFYFFTPPAYFSKIEKKREKSETRMYQFFAQSGIKRINFVFLAASEHEIHDFGVRYRIVEAFSSVNAVYRRIFRNQPVGHAVLFNES